MKKKPLRKLQRSLRKQNPWKKDRAEEESKRSSKENASKARLNKTEEMNKSSKLSDFKFLTEGWRKTGCALKTGPAFCNTPQGLFCTQPNFSFRIWGGLLPPSITLRGSIFVFLQLSFSYKLSFFFRNSTSFTLFRTLFVSVSHEFFAFLITSVCFL